MKELHLENENLTVLVKATERKKNLETKVIELKEAFMSLKQNKEML